MAGFGRLVVARHLDGRLVKGRTEDFRPERDTFHVEKEDGSSITRVRVGELKALFFVKSLDGDRNHTDHKRFQTQEIEFVGTKTWIEFVDGEKLAGWAGPMEQDDVGFYILPTDRNSNLEKAFVVNSSLKQILQGDDAVQAAKEYHQSRQPRESQQPPPDSWDSFVMSPDESD